MNQHFFDVPFAFSGDVTAIPDPLQTGGTVSFTEGWNYNYQRDLTTDPAALPIDRSTMNWLLLQITTAIQALQKETIPEFINASQNGGTAIAYNPQAVVLWSASGNAPFTKFVNILTGTNSNTPSASDVLGTTTGWQVACDPIATSAQATAGTNNASIMTPLLVAQQTALRALLAGNSSQVFNVGPAVSATQAPQLQQVQALQGNYTNIYGYTASQTLTVSQLGAAVVLLGSTASTFTLPSASTIKAGGTLAIANLSGAVLTVVTAGGSDQFAGGGITSGTTTITLQPGDDLELVGGGSTNVYCVSGSALRQFNPLRVGTATASTHAVTLAQVQTYRGTLQGVGGANASTTYTAAQVIGSEIVYYGSTASQTLTLPTRASVVALAPNATVGFINRSSVAVTIATASGDGFAIAPNNTGLTSIVLQPGDDLQLVTDGSSSVWNAIGGASLRQFNPTVIAAGTATTHAMRIAQEGHGRCQLAVTSSTVITLSPHNGNNVIVNGIPLTLPSAGVTASNSGLTASTVYYVYLAGTTASPSLVLSTTTHVTGSNGVEVMSGDATKTLVGMVYSNASSQFVPSASGNRLLCRSWFERIRRFDNVTTGSYTTTSTSLAEISSSMRINFLCWADEAVQVFTNGLISNSTASATTSVTGYMDGASVTPAQAFNSPISNAGAPYNVASIQTYTEGVLHFYTLYGSVSSGTGTVTANVNIALV